MTKKITVFITIIGMFLNFAFAESDIIYYGLSNGAEKIATINFSDILMQGENYWAKPAIYEITALDVMSGLPGVVFSPSTQITNEQAIATVLNALGKKDEVEKIKSVSTNWSDKYIKYGMNNGIITEKVVMTKKDTGNNLEAMKNRGVYIRDNAITREEIASLVVRAFSIPISSEDKKPIDFFDKAQIDPQRVSHVDAVSMAGIMVGTDGNMFNPKAGLTRAEFAQILKNCESYLLNNLGMVKKTGFVDGASATNINMTDEDGNSIEIKLTGMDIPVLRRGNLTDKYSISSGDEVELFINTTREVKFIRVIDEGISGSSDTTKGESRSKQGIVVGNSPYFYQISIKDKNGNVENYTYGKWTVVYKDSKETTSSDILQGDTVYLEFDEIGDIVEIRAVTNSVITYGTIIKTDDSVLTIEMDDGSLKKYSVARIPVYKNGIETSAKNLQNGEYAKISSSSGELIKIEIVIDERTIENLYKGTISSINLIQNRMIIMSPEKFANGKWTTAEDSFITLPIDDNIRVVFNGVNISKNELGQKQVGKYAYIATREDTKELEKIKSITIGTEEREETAVGEIRTYNENSYIKIYDESTKFYIDEGTIFVVNDKIVENPNLDSGDRVSITAALDDEEYFAKVVRTVKQEEEREVEVYSGKIKYIDESEELTITSNARFEDDEWYETKSKQIVFTITSETRIFSDSIPIALRDFTDEGTTSYKNKPINVIAYGDEIISLNMIELGDTPDVIRASVSGVNGDTFNIKDAEYYDFEEEDWLEDENMTITVGNATAITKNGQYAKIKDIEKNQEAVIIKPSGSNTASIILLNF